MKITVEADINASLDAVWNAWVDPADICQWNAASDDWHTTSAVLELLPGGTFNHRMEAKDGSAGFDLTGTYTRIEPGATIEFVMDDERVVSTVFEQANDRVKVVQTFDAENEFSIDQQRSGWQSILNRFAQHVEAKSGIKSGI